MSDARDDPSRPGAEDGDLEAEGIPDLEGPLAAKVHTGDAQEGLMPPAEHPVSLEYGITAAEQRAGESLGARLAHEVPERAPGRATSQAWSRAWTEHQYVASGDGPLDEGLGRDTEAALVAEALEGSGAPSAEEAAMTIRSERELRRAHPDEEAVAGAGDLDVEALAEEAPAPRHLDERYVEDPERP